MSTFIEECNGYRPRLPRSQWVPILRALPIRPPGPGEIEFTAQARELTALTSGHRRQRAVALAEMPDLTLLERMRGEYHLRLVIADNRRSSRRQRMTDRNVELRLAKIDRLLAALTAERDELVNWEPVRRPQAVDRAVDGDVPAHPPAG